MIYVGIDYSITSPGLCILDGDNTEYHFRYDYPKRKKIDLPENFFPEPTCDSLDEMYRYINNAEWVLKCIGEREAKIVIEGYAFGGGGRVFQLAENCGVLKYLLHKNGFEVLTPSPAQVKKFFTGKGNATKEFVVWNFEQRTGHDLYKIFGREKLASPMSDIADSYAMACYCREQFGEK